MLPALQKNDYYAGTQAGINAIIGVISNDPEYGALKNVSDSQNSSKSQFNTGNWIYIGFFIVMWLGGILGRSRSWWLGGVLGAIAGVVISFMFGFVFIGIFSIIGLTLAGLVFDFFVSRAYEQHRSGGTQPPWWFGGFWGGGFGGSGGGGGGGFGGFGGGRSGGGGASGGF